MKVDYDRESLMAIHPTILRAMIVEQTHHTVEIQLYEALSKGKPLYILMYSTKSMFANGD